MRFRARDICKHIFAPRAICCATRWCYALLLDLRDAKRVLTFDHKTLPATSKNLNFSLRWLRNIIAELKKITSNRCYFIIFIFLIINLFNIFCASHISRFKFQTYYLTINYELDCMWLKFSGNKISHFDVKVTSKRLTLLPGFVDICYIFIALRLLKRIMKKEKM